MKSADEWLHFNLAHLAEIHLSNSMTGTACSYKESKYALSQYTGNGLSTHFYELKSSKIAFRVFWKEEITWERVKQGLPSEGEGTAGMKSPVCHDTAELYVTMDFLKIFLSDAVFGKFQNCFLKGFWRPIPPSSQAFVIWATAFIYKCNPQMQLSMLQQ